MSHTDFIGLIHSLVTTGESALGSINVLTARMNRDGLERSRSTAERSLRLLEVLAVKTRGNLDAEEAELLTNGIQSLRVGLEELERQTKLENAGPDA